MSTVAVKASPLPPEEQQRHADRDGTDTRPDRNVDRLLFLHGQLDRSELHVVGLFREAEAAVQQAEDTGDNEHDACELDGIHRGLLLCVAAALERRAGSRTCLSVD